MSVVTVAATVVQLVAVGKELVDLFEEGKLTEEELTERWNANVISLSGRETRWRARQEAKAAGTAI